MPGTAAGALTYAGEPSGNFVRWVVNAIWAPSGETPRSAIGASSPSAFALPLANSVSARSACTRVGRVGYECMSTAYRSLGASPDPIPNALPRASNAAFATNATVKPSPLSWGTTSPVPPEKIPGLGSGGVDERALARISDAGWDSTALAARDAGRTGWVRAARDPPVGVAEPGAMRRHSGSV